MKTSMKAKELMIGDLVRIDGRVVQIESIVPDSKQFIAGGEKFCYAYDDGKYEPIPLTEDILKANGFEHRDFTSGNSMHYDHSVTVYLNKDGEIFMLIGGEQRWVRYVHELQHALRLCGLNELADNFKVPEYPNTRIPD